MSNDYKTPAMTTSFISLNGLDGTEKDIAEIRAKAAAGDKEWQILLAEYDISNGTDVQKNLDFLESLRAQKDPLAANRLGYLYGQGGALYDNSNESTEAECAKKQWCLMREAAEYGSENAVLWLVINCSIFTERGTKNDVSPDELSECEKWCERAIELGLHKESGLAWHTPPEEFLANIKKNSAYKKTSPAPSAMTAVFSNPDPADWASLTEHEKEVQIEAKKMRRTQRNKTALRDAIGAREEAEKSFDAAHEKIISILEDYLSGGYAKTLANILVYIGGERAEKIISKIPEEIRENVRAAYSALSEKKPSDPDIMADTAPILKKSGFYGTALVDAAAKNLSVGAQRALVDSGDYFLNKDPILALNIERNLIRFENIAGLDDRAIQRVLREVESDDLAKALKKCDEEIQDKIFRNMSRRAAQMLREDMEFMGPVRLSDIEAAQLEITSIIRTLNENGDIIISDNLVW